MVIVYGKWSFVTICYMFSGGKYATVFRIRIHNRLSEQQYVQGASTKVGNLTDLYLFPWKNFIIEPKEVNPCQWDNQGLGLLSCTTVSHIVKLSALVNYTDKF